MSRGGRKRPVCVTMARCMARCIPLSRSLWELSPISCKMPCTHCVYLWSLGHVKKWWCLIRMDETYCTTIIFEECPVLGANSTSPTSDQLRLTLATAATAATVATVATVAATGATAPAAPPPAATAPAATAPAAPAAPAAQRITRCTKHQAPRNPTRPPQHLHPRLSVIQQSLVTRAMKPYLGKTRHWCCGAL